MLRSVLRRIAALRRVALRRIALRRVALRRVALRRVALRVVATVAREEAVSFGDPGIVWAETHWSGHTLEDIATWCRRPWWCYFVDG